MARAHRAGNQNKRKGSNCSRKRLSPRAAKRRKVVHLYWKDKLARREASRVVAKARNNERRAA